MLDIKLIRENKDIVTESLRRRGPGLKLDELLELDSRNRAILKETEELRARRQTRGSSMVPLKLLPPPV